MTPAQPFRLLAAAAFAAANCLPFAVEAAPQRKAEPAVLSHDGVYAVDIVTQKGSCDRSYRWTVAVADGRVRSTGGTPMEASGRIDRGGLVSFVFRQFNEYANVVGRLKGASGSGTWSSPTLQCAGYWRATRQS